MIITRSPMRVSLGGGGTDLPSYYQEHGGYLIASAIDKYVYVTMHRTFEQEFILKYSQMERTQSVDQIKHPIIREALNLLPVEPHIEITSMADIPAGTGLGSSGSFTCALLKALHTLRQDIITPHTLACEACHIEIDRLSEPIGKQDQYISAYGGINEFIFHKDGTVSVQSLHLDEDTIYNLEDNLLLFFTGYSRAAASVLKEQDDKSKDNDAEMVQNLHMIKKMGFASKKALEQGDLEGFADLMNTHWESKKQRSMQMSNQYINQWYDVALKNGALGGKLIGAGGGGFLMFYSDDNRRLRSAMHREGLREIRFSFDFHGSQVVTQS
jgi:D-glycero-alpha-D-manno-heptose-7-phosphate kinase